MTYDLLKIAHLVSMVLWIGSAFTIPVIVLGLFGASSNEKGVAIKAIRLAHSRIAGPAIVGTWVFGIALLSVGGWFDAQWLWAKLAIVLVLSALHGAISGTLRRLSWDGDSGRPKLFWALVVIHAIGLICVVALVVLKPF